MKIYLAGVSGSLGKHLAKDLLSHGHEVFGISRHDPNIEGIQHIKHDLRFPMHTQVSSDSIVINAAAVTRDGYSREVIDTNLAIAKNCIMFSNGPQVFVSSSSVYDLRKASVCVREDAASGDYPFLNSYSESKYLSELLYLQSGRSGYILRPHALVGPDDSTLLPRLRNSIRSGKLYLPRGGAARHEFTTFQNFSNAVNLCLENISERNSLTTLNISDGVSIQLSTAIQQSLLPEKVEIKNIPTQLAMYFARVQEITTPQGKEPRLSRYAVSQLAFDRSYDLELARETIGYSPVSAAF